MTVHKAPRLHWTALFVTYSPSSSARWTALRQQELIYRLNFNVALAAWRSWCYSSFCSTDTCKHLDRSQHGVSSWCFHRGFFSKYDSVLSQTRFGSSHKWWKLLQQQQQPAARTSIITAARATAAAALQQAQHLRSTDGPPPQHSRSTAAAHHLTAATAKKLKSASVVNSADIYYSRLHLLSPPWY